MAFRDVDDNSRQVPFIWAHRPDDDLLTEPVNAVRTDDAKLLLVAARPFGERPSRGFIHALTIRRLLVLPEPALGDQGSQPEDGIVAKLRRRPDFPIELRTFARHPGPPEKDVGPLERVQDQLQVLELCGIGALRVGGFGRAHPPLRTKVHQTYGNNAG
jgi:hypothetical protein